MPILRWWKGLDAEIYTYSCGVDCFRLHPHEPWAEVGYLRLHPHGPWADDPSLEVLQNGKLLKLNEMVHDATTLNATRYTDISPQEDPVYK